MMRHFWTQLSLVLGLTAVALCATAKERYTRVYMFGVSLSFTDSVCVLTPIQAIDSAYISNENFLKERTLYAYQLENYLEAKGRPSTTCVVMWDEKRQNIDKLYAQLRKKYTANSEFKLQHIDVNDFAFQREEHIKDVQ